MADLKIHNLKKGFDGNEIIKGIDLDIRDREFVVFVGPSGCGKSTLLRLIAGLEEVSSGRIELDGRDITDVSPAKRDLAMVFQTYALYPHMTVRKNMSFALELFLKCLCVLNHPNRPLTFGRSGHNLRAVFDTIPQAVRDLLSSQYAAEVTPGTHLWVSTAEGKLALPDMITLSTMTTPSLRTSVLHPDSVWRQWRLLGLMTIQARFLLKKS